MGTHIVSFEPLCFSYTDRNLTDSKFFVGYKIKKLSIIFKIKTKNLLS